MKTDMSVRQHKLRQLQGFTVKSRVEKVTPFPYTFSYTTKRGVEVGGGGLQSGNLGLFTAMPLAKYKKRKREDG